MTLKPHQQTSKTTTQNPKQQLANNHPATLPFQINTRLQRMMTQTKE
jgi:hypothetical protein